MKTREEREASEQENGKKCESEVSSKMKVKEENEATKEENRKKYIKVK